MLVLGDGQFNLRTLVHPHWRTIVQAEDLDYIESLFLDFPERTRLHPDELIQQLSLLSVGPLVTHESGPKLANFPAILELCSWFIKL